MQNPPIRISSPLLDSRGPLLYIRDMYHAGGRRAVPLREAPQRGIRRTKGAVRCAGDLQCHQTTSGEAHELRPNRCLRHFRRLPNAFTPDTSAPRTTSWSTSSSSATSSWPASASVPRIKGWSSSNPKPGHTAGRSGRGGARRGLREEQGWVGRDAVGSIWQ